MMKKLHLYRNISGPQVAISSLLAACLLAMIAFHHTGRVLQLPGTATTSSSVTTTTTMQEEALLEEHLLNTYFNKNETIKMKGISPPKTTLNAIEVQNATAAKRFIPPQQQQEQQQQKQQAAVASLDTTSVTLASEGGENNSAPLALTHPPLESLVGDINLQDKETVTGDPQFLLDFAIVGHGKCGTTTLMFWLEQHPEIKCIQDEVTDLVWKRPALLIYKLYTELPQGPYKRGYKSPFDIRFDEAIDYFRTYWPKTKLIVGLRHPVLWFQSLYNFRVQNFNGMKHPNDLIGGCFKGRKNTCTNMGRYHLHLSRLGKTNMTAPEELHMRKTYPGMYRTLPPAVPNEVFLYDVKQMEETDMDRAIQFRTDLKNFLGLKEELPPIIRYKPGRKLSPRKQAIKDEKKINICEDEYALVREELMKISREASIWIRKYFLEADGVVVSSKDYFCEILESWMRDPCDDMDNA